MCTESLDWRESDEPEWLHNLEPDLITDIQKLRAQGRSLPLSMSVGLVGGLVMMLGMALDS